MFGGYAVVVLKKCNDAALMASCEVLNLLKV
jgi:hypothetical protein